MQSIHMDEVYPGDKGSAKKDAWIEKKITLVEQFKEEYPDYPVLARKHAAENARKVREGISN